MLGIEEYKTRARKGLRDLEKLEEEEEKEEEKDWGV